MVKHWLITGGCGFIGSSLVNQDQVHHIRILDNLSVGQKEDLREIAEFHEVGVHEISQSPEGVELVVGDIKDYQHCEASLQGVDCVVHLAANTGVGPSVEDPRLDMQANVGGSFNLLEAARQHQVGKFIYASSGAPIGECEPPIHEEKAPHPASPYGASKLAGEGYCSAYYHTFGVNTTILRFGNVYGPRSKHKSSVVAKFIKQAINGEICEIYGDGKQTRDFIYIDDLLEAILKASEYDKGGEIFQIATNQERTVEEIAEVIQDVLKQYDITMQIEYGEARVGDVKRNFSDVSKAKTELEWEPSWLLNKGIEQTVLQLSECCK